jgi:CheY-like chemotaxis protein
MKTARLLLVDDNPDDLEVLTVILGEKYLVLGYRSAPEALTALDTARPDLLVLDIGMSPVDGLQCLQTIRARPGYDSIPAIALTAYARDVERDAFLAAGFQAVVTKPVLDHRDLFAAIAPLLAERPGRMKTLMAQSRSLAKASADLIAETEAIIARSAPLVASVKARAR